MHIVWDSVASTLATVGSTAATIYGYFNKKKINEVHVLVNSRLDATLNEVADLKAQRDKKASRQEDPDGTPASG